MEGISLKKLIKKVVTACLLLFTMAAIGGTINKVSADEPQKAIFIGDDTLKGLEGVSESNSRFVWKYESRKGLTWLKAHEKDFGSSINGNDQVVIVFSIGLSEVSNTQRAQNYVKFFNSFVDNIRNDKIKVYVKSVDSVDEAKYGSKVNDRIIEWNSQIKGGLSDKITFVDTYGITQGQGTLSNGYYRDEAQNQQIFDYVLSKVGMSTNLQLREKEVAGRDYTEAGVNTWGKDREGKPVYYDESGQVVKSTWKDIDGATYYFDQSGHYYTGLHEFDGYTSFFNEAGILTRGKTAKVDKEHYMLFDKDGKQLVGGWQDIDGKKYYIEVNGYAVVGWWKIQTTDYYFTEDGSVARGITKIGEDFYWFSDTGFAKVGWYEDGDDKFYFGDGGKMVKGEATIEGKNYYFKEDGIMAKGWITVEGNKFYFDPATGEAASGRKNIDGKIYYFTEKGQLKSGWVTIEGKTYYYNDNGEPYTGQQTIDGKQYFFNGDGVAQSGWQGKGKDKRYYKEKTFEMATGWEKIKGSNYYFNSDGTPARGFKKVDGSYHIFSDSGKSQFSIPAILVNLIILGIIGGIGFFVYKSNKAKIDPIVLQLIDKMSAKH